MHHFFEITYKLRQNEFMSVINTQSLLKSSNFVDEANIVFISVGNDAIDQRRCRLRFVIIP